MSKRTKKTDTPVRPALVPLTVEQPVEDDQEPQLNVRCTDPRLPEAVRLYAKATRRSGNVAMNILLEEGLQRAGFWPPSDD